MSFGYAVGDVIAVGKLAWDLYHDCYLVARSAPQEFKLLVEELKTLHAAMKMFEDELKNADSLLARSGEDRRNMVQNMVDQVKAVLIDLQAVFNKHRNLGNNSRQGIKKGWDRVKWSFDAKDVDGLRNKVYYRCCLDYLNLNFL